MSPCSTPATMSKYSVSLSGERTFTLVKHQKMMSINPPQSFDWTVRNLHKAFNEWLEEVNLFFEFQKFEGEGRDSATKAANVEKKKRSLFIYLLGKKGQQIYKTLTIKNAKGETIENDDEKKT